MWANNQDSVFFCVALVVQAAALLSVVIARLGQREENQVRYERFFFCLPGARRCHMFAGDMDWIGLVDDERIHARDHGTRRDDGSWPINA